MSTPPSPRRLLTLSGLLLLLLILVVAGEFWFLRSGKLQEASGTPLSEKVSAKSSQQFGEALQRAGIETQASPSH